MELKDELGQPERKRRPYFRTRKYILLVSSDGKPHGSSELVSTAPAGITSEAVLHALTRS